MLFNSYSFIFLFLPVVLTGFFWLARSTHLFAAGWLALASLAFYGYWNPAYVALLLVSIVFNYVFGLGMARRPGRDQQRRRKQLLTVAVACNLMLLAYYKYANFFVNSVNSFAGTGWSLTDIVLPLGISFFTFTQIAFLVDAYRGTAREYNFIHYLLFVTYFPHLIAGPVLHHKEMMPQFASASTYRFSYENMSVGLTIFFIGLFKKVILADGVAVYVAPVFAAAAEGTPVAFFDAWAGALCYTLQLYFDFSGYSDMAIGLSRMFGITLPLNFHSPYKAANIIEFWRRWHMTLSRFLRDYLYIPLGGSRNGSLSRYTNLIITMVLGGLWHGAGWTFVIWGALHGCYLVVNHAWQNLRRRFGQDPSTPLSAWIKAVSVAITFVAVVVAWVIFRATSIEAALAMLKAMAGVNGVALPATWTSTPALWWITALLMIVWIAPNTQQIMADYAPALDVPEDGSPQPLLWHPSRTAAVLASALGLLALINLDKQSVFLYFQF